MMNGPILITGVGKRIGLALANHLLDSDIPVIGTYRSHQPGLDELKSKGASLYACDFYEDEDLQRFLLSIKENHSSLRAIIHNASDWLPDRNSLSPLDTLSRMMRIHVGVPYVINQALAELLQKDKSTAGDIIHITDYVADSGSKKHIAYAASKAALQNMSLSFAALLAPKVKVNAIAPALIMFNQQDSAEYRQKALQKALIQREGGVSEIIDSVNFLLNSDYITGRTLHIDGGRNLA